LTRHCLVMLSVWAGSSFAHAEPGAAIALKGGFNAATTASAASVNRYGFTGGLAGSLRRPLSRRLSIAGQLELLYTPRGPRTVFEGEYLGQVRMHYADAVLAAHPEVRLGPVGLYLLLGGSLNLLLSANSENYAGFKEDITGALRRYDVALLAGAGVAWRVPAGGMGGARLESIFLEVRHDHGLLPAEAMEGGLKNRTSSLMVGLSLAWSKHGTGGR